MIIEYAKTIVEYLPQFIGSELDGVKRMGIDPAKTGAKYKFVFLLRKIAPRGFRGIDWSPAFRSRILDTMRSLPQNEIATFMYQVSKDTEIKKSFTYLTNLDVNNIIELEVKSDSLVLKIMGYGIFS